MDGKFSGLIRKSLPFASKPALTDEQMEKLKTAGSIALVILGVAGAVALSAVAPNIFLALDKILSKRNDDRKFGRRERENRLVRTFYYLKRYKYITMKPTGKDFNIFLTRLGRGRLKRINFERLTIPRPKKWEGKWWQVAADIPTKQHKWAADALRKKLKSMKFYSLQRTLWFYPHDPREELEWIIEHFGIGQFVTVMEVSRLDSDDEERMRDFFEKEKIF